MSLNDDELENTEDKVPEFIEVTDILDLHGTPVNIIPEMIADFIDNAMALQLGQVQIIHGKGRSRLKHLVYQLLADDRRVIQFYDAPPGMGGWGRTVLELDLSMDS